MPVNFPAANVEMMTSGIVRRLESAGIVSHRATLFARSIIDKWMKHAETAEQFKQGLHSDLRNILIKAEAAKRGQTAPAAATAAAAPATVAQAPPPAPAAPVPPPPAVASAPAAPASTAPAFDMGEAQQKLLRMRGKYRDMLEETLRKQQLEGKPSDKTQKILNLLLTAPADVTQKTLVFLTKVEPFLDSLYKRMTGAANASPSATTPIAPTGVTPSDSAAAVTTPRAAVAAAAAPPPGAATATVTATPPMPIIDPEEQRRVDALRETLTRKITNATSAVTNDSSEPGAWRDQYAAWMGANDHGASGVNGPSPATTPHQQQPSPLVTPSPATNSTNTTTAATSTITASSATASASSTLQPSSPSHKRFWYDTGISDGPTPSPSSNALTPPSDSASPPASKRARTTTISTTADNDSTHNSLVALVEDELARSPEVNYHIIARVEVDPDLPHVVLVHLTTNPDRLISIPEVTLTILSGYPHTAPVLPPNFGAAFAASPLLHRLEAAILHRIACLMRSPGGATLSSIASEFAWTVLDILQIETRDSFPVTSSSF